ncbi:Dicer, partial [Diplonema papillatum]
VCLHFQYDPLQHNATKVKETLLREYTRWRFQPLCDRNPSVPELRNFDIFNHSVMKLVRRLPPVLSTETTAAVVEALADCERKWDTMQVCTKRQQLDGVFTPTSLIVKRTLNSCRSVPLDVDSISYSMAPYKLYDKVIYICSQDIVVTEEIIRTLCGMVLPGGKVVLLLSNSIYSSGSEGNKPRLEKLHFDVLRNVPQIWKAVRRSCVLLPE